MAGRADDEAVKDLGPTYSVAMQEAETVEAVDPDQDETTPVFEADIPKPAGVQVADSTGEMVTVDPAFAGSVGGNTSSLGGTPTGKRKADPVEAEEDLGPEGTIVQEIGGEARH